MNDLTIREVISKKDFNRFIKFPYRLYKNDAHYVPNLISDEKKFFTDAPSLDYCTIKSWIVLRDRKVVGRISAILNPRYNEHFNLKRGRFCCLEFEEDIEILKLLFSTAEAWLKSLGMNEIHGPLGYNNWYKQGMLVEGFENTPPANCIYNPPYYPKMIEQLGFEKESDWIQSLLQANQGVSDRLERINDMLIQRYHLRVMGKEEFNRRKGELAKKFFENYNETFSHLHNFVPLTDHEMADVAKQYIGRLDPELSCLVMDENDTLAAYGICFPSMSEAFRKAKGHLFPFGWYHLLKGMKHYEHVDLMLLGAAPYWQNKGVSAVYHKALADTFRAKNLHNAVTNPQLEDNSAVKVWTDYSDCKPFMRRRCYIKKI